MTLTVAIVGRPNVGKSTLFNRLVGKKLALVDPTPGVTRDRREGTGRLGALRFRVIDTAGLEDAAADSLSERMLRQTETALAEADVALFLVDARTGITALDSHFASRLRRQPTPVILVANKCEGTAGEAGLIEAFSLGLGEPVAISAEHGEGLADLYEALQPLAEATAGEPVEAEAEAEAEAPAEPWQATADQAAPPRLLQLAIVGRPNVGKSTLINRLLGEERLLTGPEAGLTRDAIGVDWRYGDQPIRLVDTAGLRRHARVTTKLERLSAADAVRSMGLAQVVVVVVDGLQPLEKQDLAIAGRVVDEGRALVLAINKWDLVDDRAATLKLIEDRLENGLPQARGVPVVTLSALTGRHVERLLPAVLAAYERWNRRIPTAALNRWLAEATERHPPPAVRGRRIRLRYATQVKSRPPTVALFVSRPAELPESYIRYLAGDLRQAFDLPGVPLRLYLRKGRNPYAAG